MIDSIKKGDGMLNRFGLILIFLNFLFINVVGLAFADKVYLKSGLVVEGKIMMKTSEQVTINDGKFPRKFFMRMVEKIEEDDVAGLDQEDLIDVTKFPDIPLEKIALIVSLLEVNGTKENLKQRIDEIIKNAPEERKQQFKKLFKIDELVENVIPSYDKYFTVSEINELISFYKSDIGIKVLEVMPKVVGENVQANLEYFKKKLSENNLK